MNRRSFLTATVATAAVVACEALPEDKSCDIVMHGGYGQGGVECPKPAVWKYGPEASTCLRFCKEHAAMCATMPLVSIS
jgi:hypothetical protein